MSKFGTGLIVFGAILIAVSFAMDGAADVPRGTLGSLGLPDRVFNLSKYYEKMALGLLGLFCFLSGILAVGMSQIAVAIQDHTSVSRDIKASIAQIQQAMMLSGQNVTRPLPISMPVATISRPLGTASTAARASAPLANQADYRRAEAKAIVDGWSVTTHGDEIRIRRNDGTIRTFPNPESFYSFLGIERRSDAS
jgi:hypothetical protein